MARDGGESSKGKGGVIGLSLGSNEGESESALPHGTHTLAGMAAPALAGGVFGKGSTANFAEIFFVNPSLANGHDVTAVVEHEAEPVGVPEEVEGADVAACVDGGDGLGAGADPDESGLSLGCLLGDPSGVGISVFTATADVAIFVNDPSDGDVIAVSFAEFIHAHGGSPDEVSPPTIVAILFDAIVFPLSASRSSTEDDVLLRH